MARTSSRLVVVASLFLSCFVLQHVQSKQYIVKLKHSIPSTGPGREAHPNLKSKVRTTRDRMHEKIHHSKVGLVVEEHGFAAVEMSEGEKIKMEKHDDVEFIEEDVKRYFLGTRSRSRESSSQTIPSSQIIPWGIKRVQADQVEWHGGIKVCIIDSGYDITHPDLPQANGTTLQPGWPWFEDGLSHGTHVAGTIVAKNNKIGVVGVIPAARGSAPIDLHIVRVFGNNGEFITASTLAGAVVECVNAKAHVINLSLGGSLPSRTEEIVFDAALASGTLSIAAASNSGTADVFFPAAFRSVVSVAATDIDNQRATFSTFNNETELAGPGVDVASTISGTGMSVIAHGKIYPGRSAFGSTQSNAVGMLIDCGNGSSPCVGVLNNICLMMRIGTNINFTREIGSCESQGGIGAVIYNSPRGNSFNAVTFLSSQIPVVLLGSDIGAKLARNVGSKVKISVEQRYSSFDGTSMATPHVVGVTALVWSNMPACSAQSVRRILALSSLDLGLPGRDSDFGSGLVQAKAAVDYYKTHGCVANPPTSAPTPLPRVVWNMDDDNAFNYNYVCERQCEQVVEWTIEGSCDGAISMTVSPRLTDFVGFANAIVIAVDDLIIDFCTDMGQCNTTDYAQGACTNESDVSFIIPGPGKYLIGLSITGFVRECPVRDNIFLDAIMTLSCLPIPPSPPTPSTTMGPGATTGTPSLPTLQCNEQIEVAASAPFGPGVTDVLFAAPLGQSVTISSCESPDKDAVFTLYEYSGEMNNPRGEEVLFCDDNCGICPSLMYAAGLQFSTSRRSDVPSSEFFIKGGVYYVLAVGIYFGGGSTNVTVTCNPTFPGGIPTVYANLDDGPASQLYECSGIGCKMAFKWILSGSCDKDLIVTVSPKITEYHNFGEDLIVLVDETEYRKCSHMGFCRIDDFAKGRCVDKQAIRSADGTTAMVPGSVEIDVFNSDGVTKCPVDGNKLLSANVTLQCGTPKSYEQLRCGADPSSDVVDSFEERYFVLNMQVSYGYSVDRVSISTCGSNFDTYLTVYESQANGGLMSVWECDDCGGCGSAANAMLNVSSPNANSTSASAGFTLDPAANYVVGVRGLSASKGRYYVGLRCHVVREYVSGSSSLASGTRSRSGDSKSDESSEEEQKKKAKSSKSRFEIQPAN